MMLDPYVDLIGWIQERVRLTGLEITRYQAALVARSLHDAARAGANFDAALSLVKEVTTQPPEDLRRQAEELYRVAGLMVRDMVTTPVTVSDEPEASDPA